MSRDPYVDPATGVLRNLLGIDDAEELASAERHLTIAALYRLQRDGLAGAFDLDHLRAFFLQLAREAGWHIAWARVDGRTNVAASEASMRGDRRPLVEMLTDLVERAGPPSPVGLHD